MWIVRNLHRSPICTWTKQRCRPRCCTSKYKFAVVIKFDLHSASPCTHSRFRSHNSFTRFHSYTCVRVCECVRNEISPISERVPNKFLPPISCSYTRILLVPGFLLFPVSIRHEYLGLFAHGSLKLEERISILTIVIVWKYKYDKLTKRISLFV